MTNNSHEVRDPGDKELGHAFALSFKEKGNKLKRTESSMEF